MEISGYVGGWQISLMSFDMLKLLLLYGQTWPTQSVFDQVSATHDLKESGLVQAI